MIETSLHQSEPVMLPAPSSGQVARSIGGYSLLTALMIVTPMLPVFVPAALFHCSIRIGRRAAWIAAAIALGLSALYLAFVPASTGEGVQMAWAYLAGVALAIMIPSLAALPLIERGEKFGSVLAFLLTGSAAGLALTEIGSRLFFSFSPWAAQVVESQKSNAQVIALYKSNGMPAEVIKLMERWSGYSVTLLPAFMLILVAFIFMLSLLMLGRLKAWRVYAAERGGEALGAYLFRNFSLPDWTLFVFVFGGLTPLAHGMLQRIAANSLALVVFLYVLQGLAIFRFFLAATGVGFGGAMLGWMLLAFLTLTGISPLLLGVAGLFDLFFDFRHFKKRKDDSHESHSD